MVENNNIRSLTDREKRALAECYQFHDLMGKRKKPAKNELKVGHFVTVANDPQHSVYLVLAVEKGYLALETVAEPHLFRVAHSSSCNFISVKNSKENLASWFNDIIAENKLSPEQVKAKRKEQYDSARWWMAEQRAAKKEQEKINKSESTNNESKWF